MTANPDIPHEISSARVLIRFALRIVILAVFAGLGTKEFFKTSEQLLIFAACYCAFVGGIRREAPLSPVLTHYDEAAAYAVAAGLVRLFP